MNRNLHHMPQRPSAFGALIEWEDMPSLTGRLVTGGVFQNPGAISHTWDVTMPAALDPITESGPFQETLTGLATRELREPDVFRHFFS